MDLIKINEERKRRGKVALTQEQAIRYARTAPNDDLIDDFLIGYEIRKSSDD